MSEYRSVPRRQTLRHAEIIISAALAFTCSVGNLTDAGALLLVRSESAIPDAFELTIGPCDDRHACRVIWRRPGEVGVSFERAGGEI
ncbi:PilZ domain-containing protein [Methylobacterium oxalidis]|uniref:PilZ domain-containing protein n=1 Tax=Methylobacterium oxalidis TaxID=944322 RepID=A0A512J2U7_9HYPH|nr:PilZ domain-containing protein [Methylobacterium oxalidis]GEP04286.1 hypothetical protein MOX02_23240 [Methylobacterium oxalidis]GJE32999.1 hypothetical protein LDDCCGHA_3198 [Methylobacterium oxalidis]GLS67195.1 hypothetical protein GCM10007888_55780 [Methylobacterium oxalidis]